MDDKISRRSLLTFAIVPLIATGCSQTSKAHTSPEVVAAKPIAYNSPPEPKPVPAAAQSFDYEQIYARVSDSGYDIPAVNYRAIKSEYLRQIVDYETAEPSYSIVVDTTAKHLYWVLPKGRAVRYGVGLGAQGRSWKGRAVVHWKRKWPRWTAPDDMVARSPHLRPYGIAAGGMAPGLENPLGARALYIFKDGKDTLYRIHGTPQWASVGKNASSGCVRMLMQDVMDLYDRVNGKTSLLVI